MQDERIRELKTQKGPALSQWIRQGNSHITVGIALDAIIHRPLSACRRPWSGGAGAGGGGGGKGKTL